MKFVDFWYNRAPQELASPHIDILFALDAMCDFFENVHDLDLLELSDRQSDRKRKALYLRKIANAIVLWRTAVSHSIPCLAAVEEEFGVVAKGIPKWRGIIGLSWHTVVLRSAVVA